MAMYGRAHIRIFTCLAETLKSTQGSSNWKAKGCDSRFDGVRTKDDFEVIEIVDGTTPYPTLFGLDWAFEN